MPHRLDFCGWLPVGRGVYGVRLYRGDPDRPALLAIVPAPDRPWPGDDTIPRVTARLAEKFGLDPDATIAAVADAEGKWFYFGVWDEPDEDAFAVGWRPCTETDLERWAGGPLRALPPR